MQEALPDSLARALLNQAADAVMYADRNGVIRLWNAAAVALFGFSADEAIGATMDLMIPEHLRVAHWNGFRRAMASGALTLQGRPT